MLLLQVFGYVLESDRLSTDLTRMLGLLPLSCQSGFFVELSLIQVFHSFLLNFKYIIHIVFLLQVSFLGSLFLFFDVSLSLNFYESCFLILEDLLGFELLLLLFVLTPTHLIDSLFGEITLMSPLLECLEALSFTFLLLLDGVLEL